MNKSVAFYEVILTYCSMEWISKVKRLLKNECWFVPGGKNYVLINMFGVCVWFRGFSTAYSFSNAK